MDFDSGPDYFLDTDEPQPEQTRPTRRDFDDDDDDFVDEPRRRNHRRGPSRVVGWVVLTIGVMLGIIAYLRYGSPYIVDATEQGYIVKIQREGLLFKTYEGQMISIDKITDTDRVYQRDVDFSVDDPSVAAALQQARESHSPVKVTYKRYYGMLPWRGASTTVVTAVNPANQ